MSLAIRRLLETDSLLLQDTLPYLLKHVLAHVPTVQKPLLLLGCRRILAPPPLPNETCHTNSAFSTRQTRLTHFFHLLALQLPHLPPFAARNLILYKFPTCQCDFIDLVH